MNNIVDMKMYIDSVLVEVIPDLGHQGNIHCHMSVDPGHQSKPHHVSIQGPGLNLPPDIEYSPVHHGSMRIQVDTSLIQNLLQHTKVHEKVMCPIQDQLNTGLIPVSSEHQQRISRERKQSRHSYQSRSRSHTRSTSRHKMK